ncbi:c-di-GMP-binding flagellar brake protein YcgR [Caldicoprobacter guelmensis]|uniref:flagellar brake protein n=1 Tax=Caldicoprobacter guelmensis TaxID=1170224 RepID=UPI00195E7217|nr:PilZ domain-containing protein [Caldicoprobacter guelmensis]MBM7581401.1 c-di-GMP-binding flagellar brake protein YcgR [Caldicoprobacter guelmensis]
MVVKGVVNIGEKIEVVVQERLNADEKACFSMIQDVPQDDELWITMPMLKGEPVVLSIGQRVRINFFRERGKFYFDAEVIDRERTDTVHLIRLKQVSPIHRLQRRNFYRLKINLPVGFQVIKEGSDQGEVNYLKAYTADISGGGMRLLTDEKLEPGQQLKCRIPLGEKDFLELKGLVVRVVPCVERNYKFEVGVKFVDILEVEQDRLIGFIFQQQRRLKAKGLI